MTGQLRIAVPNKGRLAEPSAALLRQAGIRFERTERSLAVPVADSPIELLFVRTEDVSELVADGVAALGITGLDLVDESGLPITVETDLGFGRCRLVAAVPDRSLAATIADFAGFRVATSHPNVVSRFFADKGIETTTVPLRGSVEVAPKLDVAEAVVDLVSTGSTMLINGLRPVVTILESQGVLVTAESDGRDDLTRTVVTMIRSVVAARTKRYILMNAPADTVAEIETIIPGIEAPTVVPLSHDSMVAIHSVVDADDVWQVLPKLEQAGASGILVFPIEQMIR